MKNNNVNQNVKELADDQLNQVAGGADSSYRYLCDSNPPEGCSYYDITLCKCTKW